MRRTSKLVVVVLAAALTILDVAEITAQVPPLPAAPFEFPAHDTSRRPSYLPWIKMCWQEQDKKLCSTRSDGRLRHGATTVSVTLIEQAGRSDKILRIMLPHNLMLGPGTRVMVDAEDPINTAYMLCEASAYVSDHTVSDKVIGGMKNDRYLIVQAIDVRGQTINWMVPVSDFGKAYDGPPADVAKFKSIYESPPKLWKDDALPWKDDTLQPHLRPRIN